ncbi:MAG: YbgC/FadM family acyl-CoA thioesterase [Phenylobacterium sp.]|uniref:YbgC/FadM family acyl-CoA thioesterase n=1 Tax=Phenylobacterium sp. TaxID=1871053 RepID=UPI001209F1F0|nr:YbgC/FadM family acyl-CoA thioesterase [Phenylobacterium sp.]TAJ68540.1 MAG: YbgC/FadM family acyl-CoA thioesterase [Phenylobacterium sp.]
MSEPSSGWLEGREHCLPVRIYYEDTDFTGMVYHANYLRYFERGRSDFFRVVGISHSALLALPEPTAFTIVRIELDYKRAARVDDALVVRTTYDDVKGPRLLVSQRITRGDELIAAAQVQAVCIDMKGRAIRPPRDMVDLLRPYFATP